MSRILFNSAAIDRGFIINSDAIEVVTAGPSTENSDLMLPADDSKHSLIVILKINFEELGKRVPAMTAFYVVSDDDDDGSAPVIPPATKNNIHQYIKRRGPNDIFIGVLTKNHNVPVHATECFAGPRSKVFLEDLSDGVTCATLGITSNGFVALDKVTLDAALLTRAMLAEAGVDIRELSSNRKAKATLVTAYYHKVRAINNVNNVNGSADSQTTAPNLRLRPTEPIQPHKDPRGKAIELDDSDEDGKGEENAVSILVGYLKSDSTKNVYVKLTAHTSRQKYLYFYTKKPVRHWKLTDVRFNRKYKDMTDDQIKDLLKSTLSNTVVEQDDEEEDDPIPRKLRSAIPHGGTKRKVSYAEAHDEPYEEVNEGSKDLGIAATVKATGRGLKRKFATKETPKIDLDRATPLPFKRHPGPTGFKEVVAGDNFAMAPIAQMHSGAPSPLVSFVRNYEEELHARVQELETAFQKQKNDLAKAQGTIQKQKNDLTNAQTTIQKHKKDLADAETTIKQLEEQVGAMPSLPTVVVLDKKTYNREPGQSLNAGLLIDRGPTIYEWDGKFWHEETTLRSLDLTVDAKSEKRVPVGTDIYTDYELKDGTHVMVRLVGQFREINGRPFYERIMMKEHKQN